MVVDPLLKPDVRRHMRRGRQGSGGMQGTRSAMVDDVGLVEESAPDASVARDVELEVGDVGPKPVGEI